MIVYAIFGLVILSLVVRYFFEVMASKNRYKDDDDGNELS